LQRRDRDKGEGRGGGGGGKQGWGTFDKVSAAPGQFWSYGYLVERRMCGGGRSSEERQSSGKLRKAKCTEEEHLYQVAAQMEYPGRYAQHDQ